jgi:hypothetical protein
LKIAVEFDAVGRVKINALHLAAQALALGHARHDLQAVAKNHPVRPVLIVLIKLGLVCALGDAVEIGKQIGGEISGGVLRLFGLSQQIINERLRMNFFLDVKRRRVDNEIRQASSAAVLASSNFDRHSCLRLPSRKYSAANVV